MHIPEWEIEEAITWRPELIGLPPKFAGLELVERQKYLKNLGRYIDLLFKVKEQYVLVEIKSNQIYKHSVITEQVLEYKRGLSKELNIPRNAIIPVLVSPKGFSREVEAFCKEKGIILRKLDENEIINTFPGTKPRFTFLREDEKAVCRKILRRRDVSEKREYLSLSNLDYIDENVLKRIKSIKTWIKEDSHDDFAQRNMARLFARVSEQAPICAHEVGTDSNGRLVNNSDVWFWLFYSVMDRRADAAGFIKAKEALEKKDLYRPHKIMGLVEEKGYKWTISRITRILSKSNFPLLVDSHVKEKSFPKSIVDAAKFLRKYHYDFKQLYEHHLSLSQGKPEVAFKSLWNEIKDNIYGVGPRIASQFIRGMVLKGPWKLPLTDDCLLEKCRFNVSFAGKMRLGLIESEDRYYADLGQFADKYLSGNRAIVSHVLWYIRKKYCSPKPKCHECVVSGYCGYFLKRLYEVGSR